MIPEPETGEGEFEEEDLSEEVSEEPDSSGAEKPEKSQEAEKPEEKSDKLKQLEAQKRHWRDKAERMERELKEKGTPVSSASPMEFVKLAKALSGYSEEEVEFITRNAKNTSIDSIIEASKDEWVQTAISAKREKVERNKKIPSPSSASLEGSLGDSFEDIKNMPDEDFKKFLEQQERGREGGI